MDTTGNTIESVPDTNVTAPMEEALPYPLDVATNIWRVVTSMMERARKARGLTPDFAFDDYLELLDSISAGDLGWFLIDEDEENQMSVINEWLDDIEATRLSEAAA